MRGHWMRNRPLYYFIISIVAILICKNLFLFELHGGTDALAFLDRYYVESKYGPTIIRPTFYLGSIIYETPFFVFIVIPLSRLLSIFLLLKLYSFMSTILSGIFMHEFTYDISKRHLLALASAIAYMTSSYYLVEVGVEGHLDIALGYAIMPLLLYMGRRVLKTGECKDAMVLGMIAAFFVSTHIHVLTFGFLFFLVYYLFLVFTEKRHFKKSMSLLLISASITLLLTLFMWIPALMAKPFLLETTFYEEETQWFSLSILRCLLANYTPYGLKAFSSELIIPLLAILSLLYKRDSHSFFFIFTFLITCVFIGVLSFYPIYPLSAFLRVPSRVYFIASLSISYLCGVTINVMGEKLEKLLKGVKNSPKFHHLMNMAKHTPILSVMILLLFSALYIYPGQTFTFTSFELPVAYREVFNKIKDETGDFRILGAPLLRTWVERRPQAPALIDPISCSSFYHSKESFWGGSPHDISPEVQKFAMYIKSVVKMNRTLYLGKILGLGGVKYVILQTNDMDSREYNFFISQRDLLETHRYGDLVLLENENYVQRIFVPQHVVLAVGGLKLLTTLSAMPVKLSDVAVIYTHDLDQQEIEVLLRFSEAFVFQNNFYDFLFQNCYKEALIIEVEDYASNSLNVFSRWGKLNINTENVYLLPEWQWLAGELVFRSYALTCADTSMLIPLTINEEGLYEIWIRMAEGPYRGNLTIFVNEEKISTIQALSAYYSGFKWFKVGIAQLKKGSNLLRLQNNGGWNQIDRVVIIKPEVRKDLEQQMFTKLRTFKGNFLIIIEAEDLFNTIHTLGKINVVNNINASNGYYVGVDISTYPSQVESSAEIFIPRSNLYKVYFRARVFGDGTLQLSIENHTFIIDNGQSINFQWFSYEIYLEEGYRKVTFKGRFPSDLDVILLQEVNCNKEFSLFNVNDHPQEDSCNYNRIAASTYQFNFSVEKTTVLAFSVAYNKLWYIRSIHFEKCSIPLYSLINGFIIDKPGKFPTVISFRIQELIPILTAISSVAFVVIVSLQIYRIITHKIKRLKEYYKNTYI
jgi:hypothetical protein